MEECVWCVIFRIECGGGRLARGYLPVAVVMTTQPNIPSPVAQEIYLSNYTNYTASNYFPYVGFEGVFCRGKIAQTSVKGCHFP